MSEEQKDPTLESQGMYLFMEDFNEKSCAKAIRFVLEKNMSNSPPKNLRFIINSPGGHVTDCFALIDTIKASKIPVYTVGLGCIASCGLLLFMSGQKGHRYLTPNTSILSHQFSWGSYGKEHELFARVKEFNLSQERMLDHYRKCTGLGDKKIREFLLPPEDVWLTAEEAVKLNVADKIVTTY